MRRFTAELLEAGLVHDISSDSHDPVGRPPGLQAAAAVLASGVGDDEDSADWYTRAVPEAIVRGEALPARPQPPGRRPFPLRRLLRSG